MVCIPEPVGRASAGWMIDPGRRGVLVALRSSGLSSTTVVTLSAGGRELSDCITSHPEDPGAGPSR